MFLVVICLILVSQTESFLSNRYLGGNQLVHSRLRDPVTRFKLFETSTSNEESIDESKTSKKPLTKVKKTRPTISKKPSIEDLTGYKFADNDDGTKIPIIDEYMWYRIVVRKNSERKLCESINKLIQSNPKWALHFAEAVYPVDYYIRMKGKGLMYTTKPLTPGVVYLKMKMNLKLADIVTDIAGIYGFSKRNEKNAVLPVNPEDSIELDQLKSKPIPSLKPEHVKMRKEEYVSVVEGERKGRYGILMGARNGKIEVCLRSEFKDEYDYFDIDDLEYLENPPEKKWKEMTAKEAVEALMVKDPYSPTIKSLKKDGVLREILNPRSEYDRERRSRDDFVPGSTKRIRSIAKSSNETPRGLRDGRSMQRSEEYVEYDNENVDNDSWESALSSSSTLDDFDDSLESNQPKAWKKQDKSKTNDRKHSNSFNNVNDDWESTSETDRAQDTSRGLRNIAEEEQLDSLLTDLLNDINTSESTDKSLIKNKKTLNQDEKSGFSDLDDDLSDLFQDMQSTPSKARVSSSKAPSKASNPVTSSNNNPQDDFDLDDLFSDVIPSTNKRFESSETKSKATNVSNGPMTADKPPAMEDYPRFEEYLDALVKYEKDMNSKDKSQPSNDRESNKRNNIEKPKPLHKTTAAKSVEDSILDEFDDFFVKKDEENESAAMEMTSADEHAATKSKSNKKIEVNNQKKTIAPKLEDYDEFDDYLKDLVAYDSSTKTSSAIDPSTENQSMGKRTMKEDPLGSLEDFMAMFGDFNGNSFTSLNDKGANKASFSDPFFDMKEYDTVSGEKSKRPRTPRSKPYDTNGGKIWSKSSDKKTESDQGAV